MLRFPLLVSAQLISVLALLLFDVVFHAAFDILLEFAALADGQHVQLKFKHLALSRLRATVLHYFQNAVLLRQGQLRDRVFEIAFLFRGHGCVHHIEGFLYYSLLVLRLRIALRGSLPASMRSIMYRGLLLDLFDFFLQLLDLLRLRTDLPSGLQVRLLAGRLSRGLLHDEDLLVHEAHLLDERLRVDVELQDLAVEGDI